MALIKKIKGFSPQIAKNVFLAENAVIIGDVHIGEGSSVWYHSVIRGDVNTIKIGKNTNIQDLVMVHCTYQETQTIIGDQVTIGHSAVIHGCTIHDCSLVGMGAIVMDNAIVQKHVIVAAGAVVLENMVLESGFLYAGMPAKKIKPLTEKQIEGLRESAEHYALYGKWYKES